MAASTKKIIEIFEVILEKDDETTIAFEDILLSEYIKDYGKRIVGKDLDITILDKGNTIVGVVETTRKDNIPPKKDRKKKKIGSLGLAPGEGLAYGNVFLYEKRRRILLYEVNKFGCYVDHFIKFLERSCSDHEDCNWIFSLKFNTILKPDEYIRMKKMDYYKSLEMQFSNPTELLKEYAHDNDALGKAIDLGKTIQSDKFTCKFEALSKRQKGSGLSVRQLRDMVTNAIGLRNTKVGSQNIKKMVISGYATDDEGGEKIEPIDLIADRYISHILLNEPRENTDLLQGQRQQQIKKVFKECQEDFKILFGA